MASRKMIFGLSGFLIVLVVVLGLGMDVTGLFSATSDDDKTNTDLIMIDVIKKQQTLEMPAAQFLHDAHTKALKERGKDCSVCHKKEKKSDQTEGLSFLFMRPKDSSPAELKKIYHDGCIGCHAKDMSAKAKKTGPQAGECRKCHTENPKRSVERLPVKMNNRLHYRHWGSKQIPADKGQETNCGSCHHQYDKPASKLTYVKFQEESCTYCHTATPSGDVKKDTVQAFHSQCVGCHANLQVAKVEKSGPTQCAGCHGAESQAKTRTNLETMVQKLEGQLPRLPRKQPEATLMMPPLQKEAGAMDNTKAGIMPVAFNHIAHEQKTEACGDCHHKSVKACVECHTRKGSKEGKFITLEQAMHQTTKRQSCVGCHGERQKDAKCAGCHGLKPLKPATSLATCETCHTKTQAMGSANTSAGSVATLPQDKEARAAMAKTLIEKRPAMPLLVKAEDIPEKVIIKVLADEYKPSEMPHRKIVQRLVENMKGNSLSTVFHSAETTVCRGCHHNSPDSKTPPSCKSCHGNPFMDGRPGRPGLKAAYHSQCMDCHKAMQLAKPVSTDCAGCHQKKN